MVFDKKAYELKNIELCERYKAGDDDAFTELFEANFPIFVRRLSKKRVSLHDAQDIIQIVFAKIYKNIKSISDSKMVNHWMAKALKNQYISFVRQCNTKIQSNKLSLEDQEEKVIKIAVDHNDPCKILEEKEPNSIRLSIIKEAIPLLKDRERRILELTLQDKEYKEIAKELNIPNGTVMSRIFYARKALRRKCKRLIDSRKITL
jgi:RNA polymerase sigma-70 factor (ECF subfamily)